MKSTSPRLYSYVFPGLGIACALLLKAMPELAPGHAGTIPMVMGIVSVILLCGSAFATIAHSDIVAERIGQPWGTLVLTLAVTLIEVSVIASMMVNKSDNPTLAREAVFSVIMIVNTGIIGLCLLLGSLRHKVQSVSQQGVASYLSVMVALAVMLLILPSVTYSSSITGAFSPFQLGVMALISFGLYGAFLYIQTVRHRGDFEDGAVALVAAGGTGTVMIPPAPVPMAAPLPASAPAEHHVPGTRAFVLAMGMLVVSLISVVLLSKYVAASVEMFIDTLNLPDPDGVTGALIAALVLMPEGIAAVRAASANHLQQSLNIALGSVLATIALTIPVMAAISMYLGLPMVLGLEREDRVLLMLALVLSILSFGTGRTNALNGIVHLIVFCVYVMLLFEP